MTHKGCALTRWGFRQEHKCFFFADLTLPSSKGWLCRLAHTWDETSLLYLSFAIFCAYQKRLPLKGFLLGTGTRRKKAFTYRDFELLRGEVVLQLVLYPPLVLLLLLSILGLHQDIYGKGEKWESKINVAILPWSLILPHISFSGGGGNVRVFESLITSSSLISSLSTRTFSSSPLSAASLSSFLAGLFLRQNLKMHQPTKTSTSSSSRAKTPITILERNGWLMQSYINTLAMSG